MSEVRDVLYNTHQELMEDGLTVYQKVIVTANQPYLIPVFINKSKQPAGCCDCL